MKQIILAIAILISFSASAQVDTTDQYANNVMPFKLPVKAISLFAYYYSQNNQVWINRGKPDYFKPLIGSGTKPDSLVNINLTAKEITEFAQNLQGERYGAVYNYAKSIFENVPAIPGYTSLITQLFTLGISGTPDQKNGFTYVNAKYGAYSTNLTNLITNYYQQGINWIRN